MFSPSKSECYCLFSGNSRATWSQMKMAGFSIESGMRTNSTTGQTAWSPMKQNVNCISLNIFMMAVEQCSVCDVSWQSRRAYQLLESPHGRSIYMILYNDASKHDLRVFIHCSRGMCRNVKTSPLLRHVSVTECYAVHVRFSYFPCFPLKAVTFCTVS